MNPRIDNPEGWDYPGCWYLIPIAIFAAIFIAIAVARSLT